MKSCDLQLNKMTLNDTVLAHAKEAAIQGDLEAINHYLSKDLNGQYRYPILIDNLSTVMANAFDNAHFHIIDRLLNMVNSNYEFEGIKGKFMINIVFAKKTRAAFLETFLKKESDGSYTYASLLRKVVSDVAQWAENFPGATTLALKLRQAERDFLVEETLYEYRSFPTAVSSIVNQYLQSESEETQVQNQENVSDVAVGKRKYPFK